jgi:hypothetical protein
MPLGTINEVYPPCPEPFGRILCTDGMSYDFKPEALANGLTMENCQGRRVIFLAEGGSAKRVVPQPQT